MVNVLLLPLLLLSTFSWIGLPLEAVSVDASIDSSKTQADLPLEGTLAITHKRDEPIEADSVETEGKPLKVSWVRDSPLSPSSDTLVTIYRFQEPPKSQGLHVLPVISVKIGGNTYRTIPSAYRVNEAAAEPRTSVPSATAPLIFRLEASVKGPELLYPGERTRLLYRILYNRDIDLTRSVLPMVHPEHFRKVGDVRIRDYQTPEATVQELTQEVEAAKPGLFHLGPSLIEGYAYTVQSDLKVYAPLLLKSETPPVTLEVKPFPRLQRPSSFNGALGRIRAEADLEPPRSATVGEPIELRVKVSGITNLDALPAPVLVCQPGFSGFFGISSLPPLAQVEGESKIFHLEIRPLNDLANQIPPIHFSSFDPEREEYVLARTQPIPIEIKEPETSNLPDPSSGLWFPIPLSIGAWPPPHPPPLALKAPPTQVESAPHPSWSSPRTLLLSLFGIIALLLQWGYRNWRFAHGTPKQKKSTEVFQMAMREGFFSSRSSLQELEQALWNLSWECGWAAPGTFHLEELLEKRAPPSVHALFLRLQALQYGPDPSFNPEALLKEVELVARMQETERKGERDPPRL